jgi:hypothetical protein
MLDYKLKVLLIYYKSIEYFQYMDFIVQNAN